MQVFLHSEDRVRHSAVLEIVGDYEEVPGHARGSLVLEPARDRTRGVHLTAVLNVDATNIGLPAHVCHNVVRHDVAINLALVCLDECLIALARVAEDAGAVLLLMLVECCQSAAIGNHHRHLHLKQAHAMTLIVWQLDASQFLVGCRRHSGGVSNPVGPLLFGQAIAMELNEHSHDAILTLERLCLILLVRLTHLGLVGVPSGEPLICQREQ